MPIPGSGLGCADKKEICMITAIVLAAGQGSRMGTEIPKQFLDFQGAPLLVHALRAFENSPLIDDILLVASEAYLNYCRTEIVDKYGIQKVRAVIKGGAERYDSVYEALQRAEGSEFVLIHDGARPFITGDIIERTVQAVRSCRAAAAAVPSKDTIKIADPDGFVIATPDRASCWNMQTPQAFSYRLLMEANEIIRSSENGYTGITDDAMIVEKSGLAKVKLVMGSYENIKITTPDDLRYIVRKGGS